MILFAYVDVVLGKVSIIFSWIACSMVKCEDQVMQIKDFFFTLFGWLAFVLFGKLAIILFLFGRNWIYLLFWIKLKFNRGGLNLI